MRKSFVTRCVLFSLFIGICAFTKDAIQFKAASLRLTRFESMSANYSSAVNLQYDQSGRIISIIAEIDGRQQTLFNVSYEGNRIVMSRPAAANPESDSEDTIVLFLDANHRVSKRVANQFLILKPETSSSKSVQRLRYDSSSYQYDEEGRLIQEMNVIRDYTKDGGAIMSTVTLTHHNEYTLVGSNLGTWKHVEKQVSSSANGSVEKTFTSILNFNYTKDYPFHTDFSNAAVLNELHPFMDFPMNGGYASLPSGLTVFNTNKDNQGDVTNDTVSATVQITYDDRKMVSSMKTSADPNRETRYTYQ